MQPPQHPEAAAARAARADDKSDAARGEGLTLYAASPHAELDARVRSVRQRLVERRRARGDAQPFFWGSARRIQNPALVTTVVLVLGILLVFVPLPTLVHWVARGSTRLAAPHAASTLTPRMPAQKTITLGARAKGCHLVQAEVESELRDVIRDVKAGIVHLFILHTSAALSLNENFDPDVRRDMDMALDHAVPESLPWRHTDEGPDDSVSHTKASLIGPSLTLPITDGRLSLGTWQGIVRAC